MVSSLLKRSGGFFFGLTLSRLITTGVFILLARHFAPAIFGQLILYVTLLSVGTYFADLGLNQWYQKNVNLLGEKQALHNVISARTYSLIVTLGVFIVFFILVPTFSVFMTALFLINIIPEAYTSIIDGYYLADKKPMKISVKHGVRALLLLATLFFVKDLTHTQALLAFFLGSIVSCLWVFPWSMMDGFKLDPIKKSISVMKASTPYAFLIVTSFAYARGDQIIIRYVLSDAALGYYGAAYRYLESISLLPAALSQNLFPIAAQKEGVHKAQLMRITFIMTALGAVCAAILYAAAHFLVVGLLGPQYQPAIIVVQIFSLVVLLFFVNAPLATIVQSSHMVRKFLPYGIANTVLNIGLNMLLVPTYGITAAACIMLLTELTGLLINVGFVYRLYK